MKTTASAILAVTLIGSSAMACEWGGIPEVNAYRSGEALLSMCKQIPSCLEKYEANEQCKKDWYENRRIGNNAPREKRAQINEYEEFKRKLGEVRILKKGEPQ